MDTVAQNEYYELAYDGTRNWVYWTMKGKWARMAVVPNFEKDWDTIQSKTKPGFMILADISKLGIMPDDVKAAQDKRQQKLMQAGVAKLATIVENEVQKMSMNKPLRGSCMDKVLKYCTEIREAEDFLNA